MTVVGTQENPEMIINKKGMNELMETNDKQKSDPDSVSIDSDHSSDGEASAFLVGSLAQLHNASSTESFDSKLDHGMKLDINDVSSGALAMHHLYFATMALAYARRREMHKGSMNEVHSCNIERLCDDLNSIENRPVSEQSVLILRFVLYISRREALST